jgi:serine/threonine protein kinase
MATPMLSYEASILKVLKNTDGFPTPFWYGSQGDYNVLVMTLLGPDLKNLYSFCRNKFSVKTIYQIAIQIITRLEQLHKKHFVHRDMKPDNICVGNGKNASKFHLIDFGLSKRYIDPKLGKHVSEKKDKGVIGTTTYLSMNAGNGCEHSRRDDLESLGYILISFMRDGKLPWSIYDHPEPPFLYPDDPQKEYMAKVEFGAKIDIYNKKVGKMKSEISLEELCKGLPDVFLKYMEYVRGLSFERAPGYRYMTTLFQIQAK